MPGPSTGSFLAAGGNLYAGYSALLAGKENASLLQEQGSLTRDDYYAQASLVRDEGRRIRAKQTMEYVSSGVEIAGTPLLVLRETLQKYAQKAGSLETTGVRLEGLYQKKAKIAKQEGQAAFISSIFNAGAALL